MKLRDVIEAHKWSKKDGRNYDKERKYNDTPKASAYRAKLNKYNRDKGTYANDDGKDASHKGKKMIALFKGTPFTKFVNAKKLKNIIENNKRQVYNKPQKSNIFYQ